MKKTSDSSINYKVLQLVLREDRCDIGVYENFDNSTLYYALIILSHPKLTHDAEEIRKQLDITLVDYPTDGDMGDVSGLTYYYGIEKYQQISIRVHELLTKYNLWNNWFVPFSVYVLSGVLPVAGKNNAIEWYPIMDKRHVLISSAAISWDDNEYDFLERLYGERVKYPSLTFTEKISSKNQLKEWIDENWDEKIEPELRKIPSRLKKAASVERLAIGLWLWEMRDQKEMSWEEIDDEINRLEKHDPDFFGNEENNVVPDKVKGSDLIYAAKAALADFYPL